ncbi:hypothetical protein Moror_3497, partial [Moniliophthora roreri MCA 2997]
NMMIFQSTTETSKGSHGTSSKSIGSSICLMTSNGRACFRTTAPNQMKKCIAQFRRFICGNLISRIHQSRHVI